MKAMPNLDLLRSIAVLLVVVEHTLIAMRIRWIGSWDISRLGVFGVFMFFVHTSLVLMWSLERKPHALNFYLRRIFRIYPLAITAILVTVLFRIATLQNIYGDTFFKMPDFKNVASNLLLIQNIIGDGSILGVMWTLPIEMDMYLVLPLLFFLINRKKTLWPILICFALVVGFDLAAVPPQLGDFWNCIPYFLSGVVAYVLFSKIPACLPAFLMPVLILVLLCIFMLRPSFSNGWWLTLVLAVSLPLFRSIRDRRLVVASHNTAKYSYGIYLVHPFCIAIGINLLHGQNMFIRIGAIVLPLAFVVIPVYHILEKPMIDLGSRLAGRTENTSEMALAVE